MKNLFHWIIIQIKIYIDEEKKETNNNIEINDDLMNDKIKYLEFDKFIQEKKIKNYQKYRKIQK